MKDFFSLTPWTSMYIKPNGNVYPCESVGWLNHETYCAGNIETHTIEELWNSDVYKKMRLDILKTKICAVEDKLTMGCTYLQLRDRYITDFDYYKNNTDSEGNFKLNLQTLYIERSNICNLTCIYCNSISSNSWAKLENKQSIKRIPDEIYWKLLKPHLNDLVEINISGGEPVIEPFTEKLIDYLLINNKNIQVNMTTNLTYDMDLKSSLFEKLNQFNNKTKLACSVDSKEDLFEAIRRNSSWDLVLKNLKILKKYDNIYKFFCIAVSVLNCFSLREFHEFLLKEELTDIDTIRYQPVCHPDFLSIRSLSLDKKKKLKYYLLLYATQLKQKESEKLKNNQKLDLWCNGNKPTSSAILNFITDYLYSIDGNENYKNNLLDKLPEHILLKAKL